MEELPSQFDPKNISSMAHVELETHREMREMARLAAWEMPLLSALSKPFTAPTRATPLRWRYTTYLGELHPAANKVVVEFSLQDLALEPAQKQTIRKLAGARWNSDTDIVKMSCESFQTQAQNKRYLGETIAALIKEAKEGADKFEDVPLDMRVSAARARKRHRRTPGVRFPEEWKLTSERRAMLDAKHGIAAPEAPVLEAPEQQPEERVISGLDAINAARKIDARKSEERLMAQASIPLPRGKMGKKEMGQQPVQRR